MYPSVIRSAMHAATRCALAITALLLGINLRNITFEEENKRGSLQHDFRHRFAAETLMRCYRKDEEVERRLPILSTYLGHAHVTDTYWYLTSTPELLGAAGKRMEKRWGGVL